MIINHLGVVGWSSKYIPQKTNMEPKTFGTLYIIDPFSKSLFQVVLPFVFGGVNYMTLISKPCIY